MFSGLSLTSMRLYTTLPSVCMSTCTTPSYGYQPILHPYFKLCSTALNFSCANLYYFRVALLLRLLLLLGPKCRIQQCQPLQSHTKPVHLIRYQRNPIQNSNYMLFCGPLKLLKNLFQFPNQFNDPMHGVKQTVLNYLNQPMHL